MRPDCLHMISTLHTTLPHNLIKTIYPTELQLHKANTTDTKVSKGAKIRNRYNQVPHLTKDTNGKVTNLKAVLLLWIFYVFVLSCVCFVLCASVYMCFVVTCWERADLLALVCGVYCEFVTFPLVSWVRCGT